MPEVPVKLYIDKLLKECRDIARHLAMLPGPIKEKSLRAMADRLAADQEKILAANEKDVDAVGKSFEADVMKDRMKAAVARVRMISRKWLSVSALSQICRIRSVRSRHDGNGWADCKSAESASRSG
jgi:gamma-glutamyl phosphate reductase